MTDTPTHYLNRELSWLEFNQRVLDEARNESNALLERLKFLAITGSNLDEFFMVRVGGLKQLQAQGQTKPDPAGMTPRQQLEAVGERIRRMTAEQYETFAELEPQLAEAGVRRLRGSDYTERQKELLEQIFENEIATVLTPQAVTSIDDFPLVINQTLNIAV
ncbi:MAG: RNA degradosome polyphosphate kinase, partial [Planctomycetales bacterium]|nr:RNA degradosome polyphosphate kinase [Planctomycetales bacterium]